DSGPVTSWPRPHTAGYSAASRPTWATGRPPRTYSRGSSPQARPSLRLLTSPAWLQADRAGSRRLVSVSTSRVESRSTVAGDGSLSGPCLGAVGGSALARLALGSARPRVSGPSRADNPRPRPA